MRFGAVWLCYSKTIQFDRFFPETLYPKLPLVSMYAFFTFPSSFTTNLLISDPKLEFFPPEFDFTIMNGPDDLVDFPIPEAQTPLRGHRPHGAIA